MILVLGKAHTISLIDISGVECYAFELSEQLVSLLGRNTARVMETTDLGLIGTYDTRAEFFSSDISDDAEYEFPGGLRRVDRVRMYVDREDVWWEGCFKNTDITFSTRPTSLSKLKSLWDTTKSLYAKGENLVFVIDDGLESGQLLDRWAAIRNCEEEYVYG